MLPLNKCRGQAYDGLSNMSGPKSGIAARILKEEAAALPVHCLAHCINMSQRYQSPKQLDQRCPF